MKQASTLKLLRVREGMTQAKVAEVLGITTNYYYKLENNYCPISGKYMETLAKLYDVTIEEINEESGVIL